MPPRRRDAATLIAELTRSFELGFLTEDECLSSALDAISQAADQEDEDFQGVVVAVARLLETGDVSPPRTDPNLLGHLAWAMTRSAHRRGEETIACARDELAEVINARVMHGAGNHETANLLAALPPQWCRSEWIDLVRGRADADEAVVVDRVLLTAMAHQWSTQEALAAAVWPRIASDDPHVTDLVADAYLVLHSLDASSRKSTRGRQAFMRMRAYELLGRVDEARSEARAVVAYHDYRDYELHLQFTGFECDPRLPDRLAVSGRPSLVEPWRCAGDMPA